MASPKGVRLKENNNNNNNNNNNKLYLRVRIFSLQANWGHSKNTHRNKILKIIKIVVRLDL